MSNDLPEVAACAVSDAVAIGRYRLTISRTEGGGHLTLIADDGSRALSIEVTPGGPVLRFGGPLAIAVDGDLALEGDNLSIHARQALSLSSGGTLAIAADGDLRASARTQQIRATSGNVEVAANDDVVLDGECIKLNC